ncbi:MAG: deoxyribodipyrimidine photo-lyase [Alphaproteobacteria bacterium]
MTRPVIVWFRRDLRLADNPALADAVATGAPVLPLYVLDDETSGRFRDGGAARWWLHGSLAALAASLRAHGLTLVLRRGAAERVVAELAAEAAATAVLWNRRYEPFAAESERRLSDVLAAAGIETRRFNAALLAEPWEIATGAGGPYRVFTPFARALAARPPPPPGTMPRGPFVAAAPVRSERLEDWALRPAAPDWASGFAAVWTPGEAGARARLAGFLDDGLRDYASARDRLDGAGASRLSPHLAWGEIGPRQVAATVAARVAADPAFAAGVEKFMAELAWREFAWHLLHHFPHMAERNWRAAFDAMAWRDDPAGLRAWRRGRTGYPAVDAGMRELWATGWLSNRARMVVASFLTKHLLVDWRAGADWFLDTLVDADLASNSVNWQWVAGSGVDAAPFFRIFNPSAQGQRYDPDGAWVRRWLPELADVPDKYVHEPWRAPRDRFDMTTAAPVVDHAAARARALAAFAALPREGG